MQEARWAVSSAGAFDRQGPEVEGQLAPERARLTARRAIRVLARVGRGAAHRVRGVALDLRLGISTEGILRNEARLRSRYSDGHYYEPVRGGDFRDAMAHVDLDPHESSFMDLGSGRGRALLLAAESGYRRVIGVELDEKLMPQAQRNVDRWLSRHRYPSGDPEFLLLHDDAASVELPDGPTVVFLCNPFGEASLRQVLDRLVSSYQSSPRPLWLCYVNPQYGRLLTEHPAFEERARSHIWVVYSAGHRGGPVTSTESTSLHRNGTRGTEDHPTPSS